MVGCVAIHNAPSASNMLFTIRHRTQYSYSQPVRLSPHRLRFCPRDDGAQRVIEHRLDISPLPQGRNEHIDLEGNRVTQVWFDADTEHLEIDLAMKVETFRVNPFGFVLDAEALSLPIDHADDVVCARGYLERIEADDSVTAFAAGLSLEVGRDTLRFLDRLTTGLFTDFNHIHRETGIPQSPAVTLESRHGACRDLAVLFVDCCRAEGLAARFASGYQRGNLQSERRHLHAWPEVYLPGAGWRGFDPTHGQIVADTHVTVAAAARSQDTMPVSGIFTGPGAHSSLVYDLRIEVSD
jgi:transglutaminase-like putative cysteine protease